VLRIVDILANLLVVMLSQWVRHPFSVADCCQSYSCMCIYVMVMLCLIDALLCNCWKVRIALAANDLCISVVL